MTAPVHHGYGAVVRSRSFQRHEHCKQERVMTASDATRTLPHLARLTFLIVEDSCDFRELLADLLRACGAVVIETDNVRSAKEQVATTKVDIIVTDLALPGEDGATFLRWLRAQPPEHGGRVPVIVVTALYERYRADDLTGCSAYLQKPVEISEFLSTVVDVLGLATARSRTRA